MEKSPFNLSKHAFFCLADNHYVFLDLRSNEYLCLGRSHTDAIKGLLEGQHVFDKRSTDIGTSDTAVSHPSAVIKALLKKGLLVENDPHGKLPAPPRVDMPSASLLLRPDAPRPTIQPSHVWNFLSAAAAASKNLRWDSIERTVRSVEDRKSAHTTAVTAADRGVITGLYGIFRTLRPYYPRPYLCLFDSLALVHFLACYSIFPQWVYGVKLEPFAAHCWVQTGNLVVNDIIDTVRDYTPILSV